MKSYEMFIGGKWVDAVSGKTFPTVNPATEEMIGQAALGGAGSVAGGCRSGEPLRGAPAGDGGGCRDDEEYVA